MMTLRKNTAGLTLIELMVTLAIIAIIAAIAFPEFQGTQRRSGRPEAIVLLTRAQGFMEKCYNRSEPRTYAGCNNAALLAAIPPVANSKYAVTVTTPTATTYILTATALLGQLNDTDCRRLTLTNTGVKGSFDTVSPPDNPTTGCWPQ